MILLRSSSAAELNASNVDNSPNLLSRRGDYASDSKYKSLEERDQEIANSAEFRKWLYDYDVEKAAMAYLSFSC